VVTWLVEHGADVKAEDENGWTVLHSAASKKNFFDSDQGTRKRTQPDPEPAPTQQPACKGRKRLSRHPCTSITQKTRPQSDHPTPITRGEKFPATRQTTRHPPHAD